MFKLYVTEVDQNRCRENTEVGLFLVGWLNKGTGSVF